MSDNYFKHETAIIDDDVKIGDGTKIWHFSHIQSGAKIGAKCSFGQNVNVSNNVTIGDGVKVQNNVSIYMGVTLEDYVFCGPSCVFTNDLTPRSRYSKHGHYKKTLIRHDATIGANATIVCGYEVGHHATIAAGAVVTSNIPPHALYAGVPAKQIGWVCECGQVLNNQENVIFICPDCGRKYESKNINGHGQRLFAVLDNKMMIDEAVKTLEDLICNKRSYDEILNIVLNTDIHWNKKTEKRLQSSIRSFNGRKYEEVLAHLIIYIYLKNDEALDFARKWGLFAYYAEWEGTVQALEWLSANEDWLVISEENRAYLSHKYDVRWMADYYK